MIGLIIVVSLIILVYEIYKYFYFNSKKFLKIKNEIYEYTNECNDLNNHIEELKTSYIDFEQTNYGYGNHIDKSVYKYKRPELKDTKNEKNIYNCSLSVFKNAQLKPFKYLCKYFNIKVNEENLLKFESILNNFCAVEEGKLLLRRQRDKILESISSEIPFLIKKISEKSLIRELGFQDIDFSTLYFPKYTFKYVSAGGNSSRQFDIILDINNLNDFIEYLSEKIKFRNSIKGQRALMTPKLREKIKERDNYTCQKCGLSVEQEPNLLLEIDHIIPLSKNGLTTEENLQTLCWKCNRSKGSKILKDN
ncbi:hypothetical protein I2900191A2_21380 [Intestinibacter bartlettii]|uniref:HNH endonuclease n=1 Tax=Intestinibacter bartlettii TaxID=261299 RepID=UPI0034A725A0